ncbi:peptidase T, partial [Staphylococcus pseudintermedius]|uniref:peptidase dimerization domain-containing protein n=1 Tax=Staphylococcus pseudintermedius TaxID=283734 RepID=UPI0010E4B35E
SAKDKVVDAVNLANTFHQSLPVNKVPEHAEGYEGFFRLMELNGNVEKATAQYIIRDHDSTAFENRKQQLIEIQKDINARYYYDTVHLVINDQYRNMADIIKPLQHIIDIPKAGYADHNNTPNTEPHHGVTHRS